MRRRQLVRTFVLDAIADDYENLEQIAKHVASLSADCGMNIESSEILTTLGELIGGDLAKAYRLSSIHPEEICGMPPTDEINLTTANDIYFWVTKKGMGLQLSPCKDWPFDENNLLRTDWAPPEN